MVLSFQSIVILFNPSTLDSVSPVKYSQFAPFLDENGDGQRTFRGISRASYRAEEALQTLSKHHGGRSLECDVISRHITRGSLFLFPFSRIRSITPPIDNIPSRSRHEFLRNGCRKKARGKRTDGRRRTSKSAACGRHRRGQRCRPSHHHRHHHHYHHRQRRNYYHHHRSPPSIERDHGRHCRVAPTPCMTAARCRTAVTT